MLCPYSLKSFSEQLNQLKADGDGVTPMGKFVRKKTDITLNNHHTRGCPVYVFYARLQGKVAVFPK